MSDENYINGRDLLIFERIIQYADETAEVVSEFRADFDAVYKSSMAKNAISMCILQIGELVGHLHFEVVDRFSEIPWKRIRAMRNIAAHNYGSFNIDLMWEVATKHIPDLKAFCERILKEREK